MKVELELRPGLEEPRIIILAGEDGPELRALREQLEKLDLSPIPALQGERTVLLRPEEILRFYAGGKQVMAQTAGGEFTVRERLYELEARLEGRKFVRISNSEIVNLQKVAALDLSLAGTIRMTLEGGTVCYVSRRYVKKIKQAVGL